ncbi:MAG: helix-turn-helix transcriptional regulator [Caulobacteraceae bacterium]
MTESQLSPPLALSVKAFCQATGVSRSLVYVLMQRGELKTVRVGNRRLVPYAEAQRLVGEAA